MADCLQEQGEETLAEMQSTFPQSTVLFRVCDVTSEASMEGRYRQLFNSLVHLCMKFCFYLTFG